MATDFFGNALIASERARARYLEAEAHRLANISKKGRIRHSVLKDAGQALNQVIQAVLCNWIRFGSRREAVALFRITSGIPQVMRSAGCAPDAVRDEA